MVIMKNLKTVKKEHCKAKFIQFYYLLNENLEFILLAWRYNRHEFNLVRFEYTYNDD